MMLLISKKHIKQAHYRIKNNAVHPIQNKIISYSDFLFVVIICIVRSSKRTYITGPRQSVVPEIEIFDEAYMWILFCIAGTADVTSEKIS